MARKLNKTIILAKIEGTPGTDATPTGGTDALLVSDASFEMEYRNVDRNLMRATMGHPGTLLGTRNVRIRFSVEMAGSGTKDTPPAWGKLLKACGFAEAVTATQRVDYTPVSSGMDTLTIYYHVDGIKHMALGCMGSVSIDVTEGARPMLQFDFVGTDGGSTAGADPTPTLTAWKVPLVVTSSNTGKLTLGCTYSAGALSGGTEYCSRGLTLNMNNDARYLNMLGCSSIDITDRRPSGSFAIEVGASAEEAMRAAINANTPTSLGLVHGTAAGGKVLLFVPQAVRLNPRYEDFEGALLLSQDFNAEPVSANDEVRIVTL